MSHCQRILVLAYLPRFQPPLPSLLDIGGTGHRAFEYAEDTEDVMTDLGYLHPTLRAIDELPGDYMRYGVKAPDVTLEQFHNDFEAAEVKQIRLSKLQHWYERFDERAAIRSLQHRHKVVIDDTLRYEQDDPRLHFKWAEVSSAAHLVVLPTF